MLLDLDQGSMSVYKGDARMGVMQAEGLSGEYSWAASTPSHHASARIASAPAPASPTEDELAAAKAWEDPTEPGSGSESDDEYE